MEESTLTSSSVNPNAAPLRLQGLAGPGTSPGLRALGGDALALCGISHDARNMVTALRLCSELMDEPGVFTEPNRHFASDVRLIAEASEQLVRRLSAIAQKAARRRDGETVVEEPVTDLPRALLHLRGLLSAVAGPAISIDLACLPCLGVLRLSEESLTRVLLNLVRNSADAMPGGGHVRITVQRGGGQSFLWTLGEAKSAAETAFRGEGGQPETALLTVEDDGPGIPREWLERIFEPGFSTRKDGRPWPDSPHHGLGLRLVRELVEEAGGTVRAQSAPLRGARLEIELPLTNVPFSLPSEPVQSSGSSGQ